MKEVTDKKYKLQIEEKLWSDQYPAAINCFGLLLWSTSKESLWINLGSQILIDLWWNSCQTVKTPLNIQNLPKTNAPNHQKWHNIRLYVIYDILYIANLIPPGLYGRGLSLKVGHWDFEWILEHDIDRPVCIKYDYEWLLFYHLNHVFWSYLITCYENRIPSVESFSKCSESRRRSRSIMPLWIIWLVDGGGGW